MEPVGTRSRNTLASVRPDSPASPARPTSTTANQIPVIAAIASTARTRLPAAAIRDTPATFVKLRSTSARATRASSVAFAKTGRTDISVSANPEPPASIAKSTSTNVIAIPAETGLGASTALIGTVFAILLVFLDFKSYN